MVSIGQPSGDNLIVHTASQSPSSRELRSRDCWAGRRIVSRLKVPYLGGGFGAKLYIKLEALVAATALLTGRPVKWSLTMEEQFYTITKHRHHFRNQERYKQERQGHGAKMRRVLEWRRLCRYRAAGYAEIRLHRPGPYEIDNVQIDPIRCTPIVPPAGALRGFGIPQLVWAYESHTDMIARKIGLDPFEFRRRNILHEGRPQATGTPMHDAAIAEVLDRVTERMGWDRPFDRGSGVTGAGAALLSDSRPSVAPTTSVAFVNIYADG